MWMVEDVFLILIPQTSSPLPPSNHSLLIQIMQTAFPLEEQLHAYPSNAYAKCWSCFHLPTTGGMRMHQRNKAKVSHEDICGNNLDKLPWISGTKAQCHPGKAMPLSPLFTSGKEAYSLSGFLLVWNYSSSLQMSKHRGGITLPFTTSASRSTIHTPSSPLLSSHAPASSHSCSFYHFTSHITWSPPPPSLWLLGLRLLLFEKKKKSPLISMSSLLKMVPVRNYLHFLMNIIHPLHCSHCFTSAQTRLLSEWQ